MHYDEINYSVLIGRYETEVGDYGVPEFHAFGCRLKANSDVSSFDIFLCDLNETGYDHQRG